ANLECVLQSELDDARRHGGRGDLAEGRRVDLRNRRGELDRGLRRELRRIETIEEFGAELDGAGFAQAADFSVLVDGHVDVVLAVAVDDAASEIAEATIAVGRGAKGGGVENALVVPNVVLNRAGIAYVFYGHSGTKVGAGHSDSGQ